MSFQKIHMDTFCIINCSHNCSLTGCQLNELVEWNSWMTDELKIYFWALVNISEWRNQYCEINVLNKCDGTEHLIQ